MGSWWSVNVGRHAVPVWGKSYVPDELMLLFTDSDYFIDRPRVDALEGLDVPSEAPEPSTLPKSATWHSRLLGYAVTAGTPRTRLELQGFSSAWVGELSSAFFDDKEDDWDSPEFWPDGRRSLKDGAAITAALATRRGQAAGAGVPPDMRSHPEDHFLYEQWMSLREAFDDPRFALSLSLSRTRASTLVTLDLTDLVLGGWLTTDEMPHRDARSRMSAAVAASGPVVVITEGASDARWLRRSLEIAAPDVAHHFEFLDFAGYSAPGGTDRVVSLTKGMAAAGVMNRIVAVLDNDTAGREAARQLALLNLPSRLSVVSLPAVSYADQYPTLGPAGPEAADVNGRAASIEFMFGDDILRDTDDCLFPVRWHSFIESAGQYQGRLDIKHKNEVGNRIDRALSEASDAIPDQVLDGCRRLSSMLLAAADPPRHIPASEGSVLTAMWRRDPFCKLQIEN